MKQSKLKACTLFAGTAALLLGLGSCNKEPEVAVEEAPLVVEHATVRAHVGDRGAATKASFSNNILDWSVGDKVVMVSNGCVNGTLECTGLDGTSGIFEGDISQFTPAGVEIYFLGNQDPSGAESTFDLSAQSGTEAALVGFLFLKTAAPVVLEKTSADDDPNVTYGIAGGSSVSFDSTPLVPFLEIRNLDQGLVQSGSLTEEELTGVKATQVKINGLKNILRIDLTTGTVSASMSSKTTVTTIRPVSTADRANNYFMAIVPQTATDLTMEVSYTSQDVPSLQWSGINWTIADPQDEGSTTASYYTDWNAQTGLTFGSISSKGGYSGSSVSGGETADGKTQKNGYNGSNVDGTSDNPQGSKGGYNGSEVVG